QPGDVLADDVQVSGPQPFVAIVGKAGRRQVVRQRIEPHPRALLLAVRELDREGNRPRETRSRDGNVLESLVEQGEDFVPARRGLQEARARGQQVLYETLIARESKKPVAFGGPL